MSIRRWWRRFDSIEVEREELINFILSEAGISQKANCFSEVKMLLKLKYDNYKQNSNLLEEEYLSIKYRKEALETSSLENIPIATLSWTGVLLSVLALFVSVDSSLGENSIVDPRYARFLLLISISIAIMSVYYVLRVLHRMKEKAKKMVYCNMVIEVLEATIKSVGVQNTKEGRSVDQQ